MKFKPANNIQDLQYFGELDDEIVDRIVTQIY